MAQAWTSTLPDGVAVTYRWMEFDFDERMPRYWHSGSPSITHFFTALSVVFPEAEKFFIDSVRYFEDEDLDPKTREEVREFVKQEAHHSHQHRLYNRIVAAQRLPLERYEAVVRVVLRFVRRILTKRTQLAVTVALEHFTATLSDQLLTNPEFSEGMDPAVKPLWLWHAVEETEHKAVCFDVYQQVGGNNWIRVLTMARVMLVLPLGMIFLQLALLAADRKLFDLRDLGRGLRFVWGKGGFVRGILPQIKAFYRPDFHPWEVDNRELILTWTAENLGGTRRGRAHAGLSQRAVAPPTP